MILSLRQVSKQEYIYRIDLPSLPFLTRRGTVLRTTWRMHGRDAARRPRSNLDREGEISRLGMFWIVGRYGGWEL
jgi:hypothetical protein